MQPISPRETDGGFRCPWIIESMSYWAHESAIVDAGATIGEGTRIWHWVHICSGARIGQRCVFGQNVFVANRVVIGDNVRVQNNVSVYDDVTLEDDVFCGPSMVFTNVINPRAHVSRKEEYRKTLVRRGATLGANSTIICGNTVGEFAFVGAGAVVTRDLPPYALVLGAPARRVGWTCRCGVRLAETLGEVRCNSCDLPYLIDLNECRPT